MKKVISLLCAAAMLFSVAAMPSLASETESSDVLSEEKIDLSDAKMYTFTYNGDDGHFEYSDDVSDNETYKMLTDGNYVTDSSIGQQTFVMIDLGDEYPISTVKAYQNIGNASNSNFVAVFDNCTGTDFTFVRDTQKNLLRTNISSVQENGAKCFTNSALDSVTHNMGTYRYIFVYNWSGRLSLSEVEIYTDTTVRQPYVSVSNFYGDNMVLQRGKPHVIKGYSATGSEVTVTMTDQNDPSDSQTVTSEVGSDGYWTVSLNPMEAGMEPYTITVEDDTDAAPVTLDNVVVGDVFLASGQSNMAYDAPKTATQSTTQNNNVGGPADSGYYKKGMYELQKQIADENGDEIRMFKMRDDTEAESAVVTSDVPVWIGWHASSDIIPETNSAGTPTGTEHESILALSSLAAFFADEVKEDGIPVGIIQASRGGSAINIWSEGGRLYNNHIAPLEGLNIAGILWYQGCANSNETGFKTYYDDFKKLIINYREIFDDDELPFMYVQLAPYKNSVPEYESAGSQRFQIMREIQRSMLDDEDINTNLYMAVSMDTTQDSHHDSNGNIVHASLIHPLGKDTLGRRMANAYKGMMKNDGRVISGPLAESAAADGNVVTVSFKENTADGLCVLNPDYTFQHDGTTGWQSDTTELEEFKVAGADGVYYDAKAVIDGNTVKVSSDKVSSPQYVSYAYSEIPRNPNLGNGAGLPASPFNIGVDGKAAPTAAPETAPPTESEDPDTDPSPEPETSETPDMPVFTTSPDASLSRGVDEMIADVDIPVDPSMQFEDGDRIAVIGDSITNADFWVSYLSEIYAAKKPNDTVKFYNMGIGGNTAQLGRDMLDHEFNMVKQYDGEYPNKAIIMFGMNNANLSASFTGTDEDNINEYLEDMSALIDEVYAKGIEDITVLAPTPYDSNFESEDVPITEGFTGARERLIAYSDGLEPIAAEKGCRFINLTDIMYALLDKYQENDKTITFINANDRVHPRECGNYIMAYIIAKSQGLSGINAEVEISAADAASGSSRIADIKNSNGELSFTYTPSGTSIGLTSPYAQADAIVPLTREFNQEVIKIDGLADGYYELDMEGSKAGPYTAQELADGINLALIPNAPLTRQTAQLYGDIFAGHQVVVNRIRNIRTAEKYAIRDGIDVNNIEAVTEYVQNSTISDQFKNAYLNYKTSEKELFDEFGVFAAKAYEDVKNIQPFNITVRPSTINNASVVWSDDFTDGVTSWSELQLNGDAKDEPEFGDGAWDTTVGAQNPSGSGAGSVKFDVGINKCRNYFTLGKGDRIDIIPGMTYNVSANVKTENVRAADTVNMSVIFYEADDTTITGDTALIDDTVKGSHDWQTVSGSVTAPENARYMRIDISVRGMDETAAEKCGTAWFDDVTVSMPVKNSGFEDSVMGIISDWTTDDLSNPIPENYDADYMAFGSNWTVGAGGSSVTASYDTSEFATGRRSVKFVSTAEGASTDRYYLYPSSDKYIKLKPETHYKITMKAKVSEDYKYLQNIDAAGLTYQPLMYGEDKKTNLSIPGVYLSVPEGSPNEWADYSMVITTPAAGEGDSWVYLRSNVMMRFASGTAWADSITVEECDSSGNVISAENADKQNKVSGESSIAVNGTSDGVTYKSAPFAVLGTAEYMLSLYTRSTAEEHSIKIRFYTSQGAEAGEQTINTAADAEFAQTNAIFTAPANAVYALIELNAKNGTLNADELNIALMTAKRDAAHEPIEEPIENEPSLSVTRSDGKVAYTADTGGDYSVDANDVYVALYNADGTLAGIARNSLNGDFDADDAAEYTMKLFIWERGTMLPLCDTLTENVGAAAYSTGG